MVMVYIYKEELLKKIGGLGEGKVISTVIESLCIDWKISAEVMPKSIRQRQNIDSSKKRN